MVKRKLEEVISSQSVNTRFTLFLIKTATLQFVAVFFVLNYRKQNLP